MSLYTELQAAGIPIASHESDLYAPDTPEVRAILANYPVERSNAKRFTNQVEGGTWLDIPFAYDPFWKHRKGTSARFYSKILRTRRARGTME